MEFQLFHESDNGEIFFFHVSLSLEYDGLDPFSCDSDIILYRTIVLLR